jgi:hypothetical protein
MNFPISSMFNFLETFALLHRNSSIPDFIWGNKKRLSFWMVF